MCAPIVRSLPIRSAAIIGLVLSLLLATMMPAWGADTPAVAASADMTLALKEMAGSFSRQTNKDVRLVFGASGTLAQRISERGGYEIFVAADEAGVLSLAQRGRTIDEGKIYGVGRIVLFAPAERQTSRKQKPFAVGGGLDGLKAALESGQVKRLALSNPELCPYGHAAREALQEAGLWASLGDKLIVAEDVGQVAQLAYAGKVDAAILPLSLVISPLAQSKGKFEVLDIKLHRTLRQRMVLLAGAGETAQMFYTYMQSPVAREILRRYGYTFPLK
jgi:molybdate transport system substrate-binding protein